MSQIALKPKRMSALLTLLLAAFVTVSASAGMPEQQTDQALPAAIAQVEAPAAIVGDQPSAESMAEAGDADPSDADDSPALSRSDWFVAPRLWTHFPHRRTNACLSPRCAFYRARAPPLV